MGLAPMPGEHVATIRNISSDDRYFQLGYRTVIVKAGDTAEVDNDLLESFTSQPAVWQDTAAPTTPGASSAPAPTSQPTADVTPSSPTTSADAPSEN